MSNITFQILRLSTFVFKKSSEIIIFTIIFVVKSLNGLGWNNVGPASQTVPNITSALGHEILKVTSIIHRLEKNDTITQCYLNDGPPSKTVGQH